jgi:hypothetical protein
MLRDPVEPRSPRRYGRLLATLALVAASMGVLMWLALEAASDIGSMDAAEQGRRKGLYIIACVALAMMCTAVVLSLWAAMRWVSSRHVGPPEHIETPYVDAWSLAGKRMKLQEPENPDAPAGEGGNGDDQPPPPGNGHDDRGLK